MEKQAKSRKPLLVGVIVAVVVLAALLALLLTQCFGGQPDDTTPSTTVGGTTAPDEQVIDLYWNVDRANYMDINNPDAGVTNRPLHEDGYYHVIFACNGEQIDLPIIDRRLLTRIDSGDLMTLVFDENGVVIDATLIDNLPVQVIGANWFIQSMGGTTVKINSSSALDGMEEVFKYDKEKTKIYDMSGLSEFIGAPTVLQKEDCVLTVASEDGKDILYIFVVGREGILRTKMAYCQHCKEEKEWQNWYYTDSAPNKTGHYYLETDVQLKNTTQIAESAKLCLDLNGYTITGAKNQRVYTTFNAASELAVMDTSEAQTGTMKAQGAKMDQGGVLWARYGIITVYSGTYDASAVTTKQNGSCVCVEAGAMFNLYGGKIIGGTAVLREDKQQGQGGAICIRSSDTASSTFNMHGGEVVGGKSENQGGNIYIYGSRATFNMSGGTIRGGTSLTSMAGNIFVTGKAVFNMSGGTITGGIAPAGGNIVLNAGATMNMTGGTITNGKVKNANGMFNDAASTRNLLVQNSYLKMYGGKIDGYVDTRDSNVKDDYNTSVYVASSAKITGAAEGHNNLRLAANVIFTVGNMNKNAAIGITVTKPGTFSSNAVKESVLQNFTSDKPRYGIGLDAESKLTTTYDAEANVKVHCICGDPNGTGTACAEEGHIQHKWYIWIDSSAAPFLDGFWYLDGDLDLSSANHVYYGDKVSTEDKVDSFGTATAIVGRVDYAELDTDSVITEGNVKVHVDLNGHTITSRDGHRIWRIENYAGNSLTITDTSADKAGKVIAVSPDNNQNPGMIVWHQGGSVSTTIYAGTFDASGAAIEKWENGGALALAGKTTIYGGTIIGAKGEEIANATIGNTGTLILNGVNDTIEIINTAERVDAFRVNSGKRLEVSGDVKIDRVYLNKSARFIPENLTAESSIGVDAVTYGRITSVDARAYAANFHAVDEGESVKVNDDGTLALVGPNGEGLNELGAHPSHCVCGTGKDAQCAGHSVVGGEWFPWDGKSHLSVSGNYYLEADVTGVGQRNVSAGVEINLCLNGHSITSSGRVFFVADGATLNIMNCSKEGGDLIAGGASDGSAGSALLTGKDCKISIYDNVNLKTAAEAANGCTSGGAVYLGNNSEFKMYGGSLTGRAVSGNGGTVTLSKDSKFFLYDGTISGGSTVKGGGGNFYINEATLTISGGTISGGSAVYSGGGNIYMNKAVLVMTDGTISDGVSTGNHAGNIYTKNGSNVTITGGTVKDGIVKPIENAETKDEKDKNGGNIGIFDATTKVTIGGTAQLIGGTADRGGNIFLHKGNLAIEGNAKITGGTANNQGWGGGCGCVHVNSTMDGTEATGTVTLSGKPQVDEIRLTSNLLINVAELEKDAKVGISLLSGTGFFTGVAKSADVAAAFVSLNDKYEVRATTATTMVLVDKSYSGAIEDPYQNGEIGVHIHCYCGETTTLDADCDSCGQKAVQWTPWVGLSSLPTNGNYYLAVNVNLGKQGGVSGSLALDLNGHTVTGTKEDTRMFYLYGTSQLAITDCSEEGTGTLKPHADYVFEGNARGAIIRADGNVVVNIYGGILDASGTTVGVRGAAIDANNSAAINIHGGTIKGGTAPAGGAVHLADSSSLTMTGGTITGGTATANGGGNIYMLGGNVKFNMTGGTIENGKSIGNHGGNLYVSSSKVSITGGTVKDGVAQPVNGATSKGDLDKNGGNIGIFNAASSVTIGGTAQIIGGEGDRGGNIFLHKGQLTIGDTAKVTGGTANNLGYGGGCGNIHINTTVTGTADTGTVTLSGTPEITELRLTTQDMRIDVTDLEKEASIGIRLWTNTGKGFFTNEAKSADVANAFHSINDKYEVKASTDNTLALVDKDSSGDIEDNTHRNHCYCGATTSVGVTCATCGQQVVTWEAWEKTSSLPTSGYYYLNADVTIEGTIWYNGENGYDLKLDLNGHTVSIGGRIYVYNNAGGGANLTITDCKGTGKIVGALNNATVTGGIIHGDKTATINIYGGTLDASVVNVKYGAVMDLMNGATLNMYGGKLIGGTAIVGGAVYVSGTSDTVNLYGGTIEGGTATNGAAIYAGKGKLNISGDAEIVNGDVVVDQAAVKLAGTPTVQEIYLQKEMRINIAELEKDANIGIALSAGKGIFTNAAKSAEVAAAFHSIDEAYEVKVSTNANSMQLVDKGADPVEDPDAQPGEGGGSTDPRIHCYCGNSTTGTFCTSCGSQVYTWEPWTDAAALPTSGHYYLTQDVNVTVQTVVDGNTSLGIDLNGFKITQTTADTRLFNLNGTLAILDTSEAATGMLIPHADMVPASGELWGSIVHMGGSSSKLYIYGGTWDASGSVTNYGSAIRMDNGTVKMYKGTIKGGETKSSGGTISMGGTSTFWFYGGTMEGGTSTGTGTTAGGGVVRLNGGTFNLSGGTIKGGTATKRGGAVLLVKGAFNMTSGSIQGGTVTGECGGNITILGGTFTMNGGTITGGTAATGGGNIYVTGSSSIFNMNGGEISNGTVKGNSCHAGNIRVDSGATVNILGGTIRDGKTTGSGDSNGGNIAIVTAGTTVTIGGDAKITGGSANRGGSIFLHTGTLKIQDNAQIDAGTATGINNGAINGSHGYAPCILINSGADKAVIVSGTPKVAEINVGYKVGFVDVSGVQSGAKIGVATEDSAKASVIISTAVVDDSILGVFNATNTAYDVVKNTEGKLTVVKKSEVLHCLCGAKTAAGEHCDVCGSDVLTWQPWKETNVAPYLEGNWYLTNALNLTGKSKTWANYTAFGTAPTGLIGRDSSGTPIEKDITVNVDLNGYTITGLGNSRVYRFETGANYQYTLNITDTSGSGAGSIIGTSGSGSTTQGTAFWLRSANHTLNIWGGTVSGKGDASASYAPLICNQPGVLNLYGGRIIGVGTTANLGAAAILNTGTMTIHDGVTISGGSVKSGGTVWNQGTMTMTGGTITGGTATGNGGDVYQEGTLIISGSAKIGKLYVSGGRTVTIGDAGLTTGENGAKIGVAMKTPGVFTSNDVSTEALSCFTAAQEGYQIGAISGKAALVTLN